MKTLGIWHVGLTWMIILKRSSMFYYFLLITEEQTPAKRLANRREPDQSFISSLILVPTVYTTTAVPIFKLIKVLVI